VANYTGIRGIVKGRYLNYCIPSYELPALRFWDGPGPFRGAVP
jgi:hypothetical protein